MHLSPTTDALAPQPMSPPDVPGSGLLSLADRAARLWPDDGHLRQEWLRAISVVRSTRRGWLLDRRPRIEG